jgi:hypothetical protein
MAEARELRQGAERVRTALTPHPHRGDLIAAGAGLLTIGVLLVNVRLDGRWGTGIFLVLTLAACALVLGMGLLAPLEGERPRAYQQVLLLAGLLLLFAALLRLDQVLGTTRPLSHAGARTWVFGALAGVALRLTLARRSAICGLMAALTGIVAALSFVDWALNPHGPTTFRWILLLLAIGFVLAALSQRERRRRESVYLIDAAGIAVLLIALTYAAALVGVLTFIGAPSTGLPGAGWKLVILATGLGLVAYAAVDDERGPAYIGVLVLLLFIALVGVPGAGGPSLWFWPLLLLALGAAAIAAGLRPRRPLPPEPSSATGAAEPLPGPGARDPADSLWASPRADEDARRE